jgi:hypothetical protein
MPFEHIIDHEIHLAIVRGSGEGSIEETTDSARRLLDDQSTRKDYSFMFVVDDINLHPTRDQIMSIVFLLRTLMERFSNRMAIVTSQIGRVTAASLIAFEADKGDGRLRAFTTESEARKWLLQTTRE